MAYEQYGNLGATTVGLGGYTAGSGSLLVISTVGSPAFSTTAPFRIVIEDPISFAVKVILKVTAITDSTHFAVTAEGTDANALFADSVYQVLTTGSLLQLIADSNTSGTFTNLPVTVPPAGYRYKQTDGPYEWISNGTNWQAYWNGYPVTLPSASGWTSEGIASESGSHAGTVHYTNGFGYLIGNSLGSQSIGVNYRAAPGSTPYSFIARVAVDNSGVIATQVYGISAATATIAGFSVGFRDSGGKYLVMVLAAFAGNDPFLAVYYSTSDIASPSTEIFLESRVLVPVFAKDFIFKIRNDGTNLYFQVSIDGQNFATVYSEAITAHLADAQNVCWGSVKDGSSPAVCLYDWTQGT